MIANREVPMICFAVGHDHFAVEVDWISSLVEPDDADGAELIDPAEILGLTRWRTSQIGFVADSRAAIVLGEDAARMEMWTITRLAAIPLWMQNHVPAIFKSACGLDAEGRLVWILDPKALIEVAQTKDES